MRPLLLVAKSITITGHTDRVGASAFNRRLAARRAETVSRAVAALGVPPERIVRVRGECCVEDPPQVNPPARRTDVEMLIVRESHEQQP
jgi:outer membrane protein OmpA-like peptidoglycan-associated protein